MKDQLLTLLNENFPEIDFTASDALVDDGILESIVLVEIISTISMELGILIPYEDIVPQNFNSVDAMAAMLERLKEA
jgi:acyl carrier protein